jgi:non-specific serine/threonine protein kinase
MRYRLLETLREFAAEQLTPEERAEPGCRHAEFFLALAKRAGLEWAGAAQGQWLERLDAEHDNLRAALAWSESGGGSLELGIALCGALGWFWIARGYLTEGCEQSVRLLAQERLSCSAPATEAAPPRPEAGAERARLLGCAGLLSGERGDYDAAREYCQESLALYRELEQTDGIAHALLNLGAVVREQGDLEAARLCFQEAVAIRRQAGARGGIAVSLANLGTVALCQGDIEAARPLFEESLALYAQLQDKRGEAWGLHSLAMIARQSDDLEAGRVLEGQSLTLRCGLGDPQGIASCLVGSAEQARAEGQPERAARLLGATEAASSAIGYVLTRHEQALYEREVAAVRVALGEARFEAERAAGQSLTVEQAVAEALGPAGPPAPG